MNKKFTVVLKRPSEISDPCCAVDAYVAQVNAIGFLEAIRAAQDEAWAADEKDIDDLIEREIEPDHYSVVVMFEGHHTPVFWGWME